MNIAELKNKLSITRFELTYLKDEAGARQVDPKTNAETKWLKHWDNDSRQAVLIHEDTVKAVTADPTGFANLGLKTPVTKTTDNGDYVMYVVVNYTAPDMVL